MPVGAGHHEPLAGQVVPPLPYVGEIGLAQTGSVAHPAEAIGRRPAEILAPQGPFELPGDRARQIEPVGVEEPHPAHAALAGVWLAARAGAIRPDMHAGGRPEGPHGVAHRRRRELARVPDRHSGQP